MKRQIGFVAIHKGVPHTGSLYQAGAKVYQSEARARAAVRNHGIEYNFVPAFIEDEESMQAFRVKTPSGVIADGIWRSQAEIPEKIPDRSDFYFDPEDTEIFQVEVSEAEFEHERQASGCKDRR